MAPLRSSTPTPEEGNSTTTILFGGLCVRTCDVIIKSWGKPGYISNHEENNTKRKNIVITYRKTLDLFRILPKKTRYGPACGPRLRRRVNVDAPPVVLWLMGGDP